MFDVWRFGRRNPTNGYLFRTRRKRALQKSSQPVKNCCLHDAMSSAFVRRFRSSSNRRNSGSYDQVRSVMIFVLICFCRHDIFWQTQVVTAGDSLRLLCQSRTKKSLMNAPLGWEFSPNDGTKAISLTRMNGFSKDPYLGFILPDNSLFIERLNYTHSGIYKVGFLLYM